MTTALVLDKYGNNAAVLCRFCFREFVVSQLLKKKNGRACPHCSGDKVIFDGDGHIQSALSEPSDKAARVRALIELVKPIATEFYQLTNKPLGVTGEVAEFVAAHLLNLTLVVARQEGFDAMRGSERIQIKGRALSPGRISHHRISRIKLGADCDVVMLVILNKETLDAREIWEAPYSTVEELLQKPNSKARERGSLSIGEFTKRAVRVWPKCDESGSGCPPSRSLR